MGVPARRTPSSQLTAQVARWDWVTIATLVAMSFFAQAFMAGYWGNSIVACLVIAFAATLAAVVFNYNRGQNEELATLRVEKSLNAGLAATGLGPEELATFKASTDMAEKNLFDFLTSIKTSCGGESTRGSARLSADDQTEAVSPGITISLSHDLDWWYAKLVLSGETGRKFLQGEYTQWKGRGRTPQEAIDAMVRRVGQSRQQRLIQEYAARMVQDQD